MTNKNTALLIIAHGSRLPTSNSEVMALKEKIVALNNQATLNQATHFSFIEVAFLELADPSIPMGITNCIHQGAKTIIIFPYFLAKGRHVKEDIPTIVEETKKNLTINHSHNLNLEIKIMDYFGQLPRIEELIFNFVIPQ